MLQELEKQNVIEGADESTQPEVQAEQAEE